MPHMVIFTSPDGKKGYHQCEELDEALRFVERLRNNEGVNDAHVFRMEEIPIEVRQYFRVELAHGAGAPAPPAPPPEVYAVEAPSDRPLEPPTEVVVESQGRPSFSIFTRG